MIVQHLDQSPHVVPLRGRAQVSLIGIGVGMFGQDMTGPCKRSCDLPCPVATILVVHRQKSFLGPAQTRLPLGQGFGFRSRRLFIRGDFLRRVQPLTPFCFRVFEVFYKFRSQYLQVLACFAVHISETGLTGTIPAREIFTLVHPLRPPCSLSR